jgi:uncharacterized membrane protein YhaH (DUF805 family)
MDSLVHYFRFDHRMRRKTFIIIMLIYWGIGTILTWSIDPSLLSYTMHTSTAMNNYLEIIRATPINYYVLAMLATIFVIPAYAARFMDMAISPFFAVLFLFPFILNLVIKSGIDISQGIVIILGLIMLIAKAILIFRRGTKGPNRFGPDPATSAG